MHEGWQMKRSLSAAVSTPAIDDIYRQALAAGAFGGKLAGAGGGGFMLLFAAPGVHTAVRTRLRGLREVPFAIECGGSRLMPCGEPLGD
jgi:D-glycero-alpha-D-manno-heptose-7-phosphate kinase